MEDEPIMTDFAIGDLPADRSLLIVEDDRSFLQRLARALESRGFAVQTADTVADGLMQVEKTPPAFVAVDYLSKPADADDVAAALLARNGSKAEPPENPMSADRVRWEHIQRIYELCGRNVSETARRLNMHRRTLQRILAKKAPR